MVSLLKYLALAALAVAVGVGGAYAYHNYVVTSTPENFFYDQWAPTSDSGGSQARPDAPELGTVAIEGDTEFDFGAVEPSTILTHDFVFRNDGLSSLNIWLTESSDGPVTMDLTNEPQIINGGTKYPVTVTLDTSTVEGEFSQTFTIVTEDPNRPRVTLTVSGRPE
ncbi:MAG: DUF1573 domain-containing protein [Planctomycetota bacterium]